MTGRWCCGDLLASAIEVSKLFCREVVAYHGFYQVSGRRQRGTSPKSHSKPTIPRAISLCSSDSAPRISPSQPFLTDSLNSELSLYGEPRTLPTACSSQKYA